MLIAQKKMLNNEFIEAINNLKEEVKDIIKPTRNVDAVQMFMDSIAAQLRELPLQHMYDVQADIQRLISYRKSIIYNEHMITQNQCLTPAPSIPSPETIDYESHRSQQITPVSYRNWHQ